MESTRRRPVESGERRPRRKAGETAQTLAHFPTSAAEPRRDLTIAFHPHLYLFSVGVIGVPSPSRGSLGAS